VINLGALVPRHGQVFPAGVDRPIMFSGLAALIPGRLAEVSKVCTL